MPVVLDLKHPLQATLEKQKARERGRRDPALGKPEGLQGRLSRRVERPCRTASGVAPASGDQQSFDLSTNCVKVRLGVKKLFLQEVFVASR